jgi:hypothetical protein
MTRSKSFFATAIARVSNAPKLQRDLFGTTMAKAKSFLTHLEVLRGGRKRLYCRTEESTEGYDVSQSIEEVDCYWCRKLHREWQGLDPKKEMEKNPYRKWQAPPEED